MTQCVVGQWSVGRDVQLVTYDYMAIGTVRIAGGPGYEHIPVAARRKWLGTFDSVAQLRDLERKDLFSRVFSLWEIKALGFREIPNEPDRCHACGRAL